MTWHAKRFYVRAAVVPARTGSFPLGTHTHTHRHSKHRTRFGPPRGGEVSGQPKPARGHASGKKGASAPPRTSAAHRRNPTPFRVDARPVWHGIGSEGRGGEGGGRCDHQASRLSPAHAFHAGRGSGVGAGWAAWREPCACGWLVWVCGGGGGSEDRPVPTPS